MFRCPVCTGALIEDGPAWRCAGGHAFDVAREGYVNLLITHQRRRREPGDSAGMLRHRRAFLDAGHYASLRDALSTLATDGESVLDVGCGEGYYTREWPATHEGLELWALDIAKPAVRMAAKRRAPQRAHYAVASAYDLPVVDASIDVAVSIFAPLHSSELERVVRPGGRVVTVTPGPDHLAGLKARLFAHVGTHADEGPFERSTADTALRAEHRHRVTHDLELTTTDAIADLVNMTPYAWYVGPDERSAVAAEVPLRTPIDFLVTTYRRP